MTLQTLHDKMLREKPEGASHNRDECPFCLNEQIVDDAEGGNLMSKTYTEDEVQALVQAAVAKETDSLRSELYELKNTEEAKALEAKIAEATAIADEKIDDLQAKLDEAVIMAESATTERDKILAWLEEEKAKAEREAEIAELREERVAKVSEVASFPEEYLQNNADRWAAMDEEAFEAVLVDYKAVQEKASDSGDGKGIPSATALHAARETNGKGQSAVKEILRLRSTTGVDPRELVR